MPTPIAPHLAAARRARRRAWRWPARPCPPDLTGPRRAGAVILHPAASASIAPDLRRFVARHYPYGRWTPLLGDLLIAAAIPLYALWLLLQAPNITAFSMLFSGMFGVLFFTVPAVMIYRGFLWGRRRRRPGDHGIATIAALRNVVVRPPQGALLADLHVAGLRFRDLVAVMQDPFLVVGRYHLLLLTWGLPFVAGWFLTMTCFSAAGVEAADPTMLSALLVLLVVTGSHYAVPLHVLFCAENLREMIAWLTFSAGEDGWEVARELAPLLGRATGLVLLPLVALAALFVGAAAVARLTSVGLHVPLAGGAAIAWAVRMPASRAIYLRATRDIRRLCREGDRVLGRAVARISERRER